MSIGSRVGEEVAARAILWGGGALLLLFVLPKVLPWVAKQTGQALGSVGNAAGQAVGSAVSVVNPTNPENVFYRIVNGMGAGLSGDQQFTLGGWLYDMTHPEETRR